VVLLPPLCGPTLQPTCVNEIFSTLAGLQANKSSNLNSEPDIDVMLSTNVTNSA
jgi:hypothetical protein